MRLGEIKNILDRATDKNHHLFYSPASLYEGQRFLIEDLVEFSLAIKVLCDQPWVTADADYVKKVLGFGEGKDELEVSPEDHQKVTELVAAINLQLPVYYGILLHMVSPQEEQVINVKLPDSSVENLTKLNEINDTLEDVFKLIVKHKGLRGDVRFLGFDVGTSWYEFLIFGGPIVYPALLGVLDLAKRSIALRTEWHKSEDIRLAAEIKKEELQALKDDGAGGESANPSTLDLETFIDAMVMRRTEAGLKALIDKLPEELNSKEEMQNSIMAGLSKVVQLMEDGAEFHPSLNPPKYLRGAAEDLSVDYEVLKKQIEEQNKSAPAQIEAPQGASDEEGETEGENDGNN